MKTVVAFFAVLFFLHFVNPTFATGLVINEFSSASNPEWVEIYNSDEQTYSLQNVVLFFDGTNNAQKVSFCDNNEISGKSFKLITRPLNSYWLSNSGDTLILKKEDDIIDSISYGSGQPLGAPSATQSISRIPDGDSWVLSNNPSPQGDEVSFVCPTPTPMPTDTPTPSPTPTPTPVPTSTPTKTPTPTSTPTKTPTTSPTPNNPTAKPSLTPTPEVLPTDEVLGESTESGAIVSPTDIQSSGENTLISSEPKNTGNSWFQKIFIFIGIVFIVSCGILTFREIRKRKLMQNEEE